MDIAKKIDQTSTFQDGKETGENKSTEETGEKAKSPVRGKLLRAIRTKSFSNMLREVIRTEIKKEGKEE